MSMVFIAGGSCMYGLSDKCPASVDKLSAFLELILSLDIDSERVPRRALWKLICFFTASIRWVALSTWQ